MKKTMKLLAQKCLTAAIAEALTVVVPIAFRATLAKNAKIAIKEATMFKIDHEALRKEIKGIWYFEGKVDTIMQVIKDREDTILAWMEKASPWITLSDIRISRWYWDNDRETHKALFCGKGNIETELDDVLERVLQMNGFTAQNMGYNVYRWKKQN